MVTGTTEERLEKLERTTHRHRLVLAGIGVAVLACAIIWVVIGTAGKAQAQSPGNPPKDIRASQFVLEDGNGKTRALLVMTEDGPGLFLYDENGKLRADLSEINGVPAVSLFDKNGKGRTQLHLSKGDGPELIMNDANGNTLVSLGVNMYGQGLLLKDANGNTRASLAAAKDETTLRLSDENDHVRVGLGVGKDGAGGIGLFDDTGSEIWGAP